MSQLHPHPDGVLVLPGGRRHVLLLHRDRDASPKHVLRRQTDEQSKSFFVGRVESPGDAS